MVKHFFIEIAAWVFILVGIGLCLTVYEFRNHVFRKKDKKKKSRD